MSNKVDTRSVILAMGDYESADCNYCDQSIVPDRDKKWVVSNVYVGKKSARRWDRLEHFHVKCYEDAGSPHGEAEAKKLRRASGPSTDSLEDEGGMPEVGGEGGL